MKEFFLHYRRQLILGGGLFLLLASLGVAARVLSVANQTSPTTSAAASSDGRQLSNGRCQGDGLTKLSVSPMKPEDFAYVIPYGLVVGGHVTPIDHQYFTMKDSNAPIDSYEVRAMADSHLVTIEEHPPHNGAAVRDRLVFAVSCRLFYYYDLVTSLSPKLQAAFEASRNSPSSDSAAVDIPVTAGEVVGRIGHQTLDFAVWDMETRLAFLVPEHYAAEPWKIHTADPLLYYTDDLKNFILGRYVRTVEPRSGKIDYDAEGKLIGNWFVQGTNGYAGKSGRPEEGAWSTHLSIAPNHEDPSDFLISLGNYGGTASQFAAKGGSPKPDEVSLGSGLVRYDLVSFVYTKADGSPWDQLSFTSGPKLSRRDGQIQGCLLVQLTAPRLLRAESFPGKSCNLVSGFDAQAQIYER